MWTHGKKNKSPKTYLCLKAADNNNTGDIIVILGIEQGYTFFQLLLALVEVLVA